MAKKIINNSTQQLSIETIMESIEDNIFYGLHLSDEQKEFVRGIISPEKKVIFCDSVAGSGKSTLALGAANLLYNAGLYDGIVYIVYPVQDKLGALPGTLEEKTALYMEPLYEAALSLGIDPMRSIEGYDNSMRAIKSGEAYIKCLPHTFLRGCNFENKIIISDETQNGYVSEIKKVFTRIHDTCKLISIGHTLQCDIYKHPENGGFRKAIDLYASKNDPRVGIYKLTQNFRGWISSVADELDSEIRCI
jgi:predicted ribonuclease YlaK